MTERGDAKGVDLDGRLLRYFTAVADELNFTRAARRLHIAQQTLSDGIAQLERDLGVQLFTRTTRSVTLTAAGIAIRPHCAAALAESDRLQAAARASGRTLERRLVLGSPDWPETDD